MLCSIDQREIFYNDALHEKRVNDYREKKLQLALDYSTKLRRIIQDTLPEFRASQKWEQGKKEEEIRKRKGEKIVSPVHSG